MIRKIFIWGFVLCLVVSMGLATVAVIEEIAENDHDIRSGSETIDSTSYALDHGKSTRSINYFISETP